WRKEQTSALPAFTPPEILEADLSSLLLDCAAFGVSDPASLRFLDLPPKPALAEARSLLRNLGALDDAGRLTPEGEAMRKLALPVRLAHMVAIAARTGRARDAARLSVLLSERGLGGNAVDLDERLARFKADRSPRAQSARALADRLALAAGGRQERNGPAGTAGTLLIHAWPDRVGKARGEHGRFVMANGRGGQLDAAERLAASPWIVVADLQGQARNARITAACTITEEDLSAELGHRVETRIETLFDREKGVLRQREQRRIGAIVLSEKSLPSPRGDAANSALLDAIRENGLSILRWTNTVEAFRSRPSFLSMLEDNRSPDVRDQALLARFDYCLLPFLEGVPDPPSCCSDALQEALGSHLHCYIRREINDIPPSHFTGPTGSRIPIGDDN